MPSKNSDAIELQLSALLAANRTSRRRKYLLLRQAVPHSEDGSQGRMPCAERGESPGQRARIDDLRDTEGLVNVVGSIAAINLIQIKDRALPLRQGKDIGLVPERAVHALRTRGLNFLLPLNRSGKFSNREA